MPFWKRAEFEAPMIRPEEPGHQAVGSPGVELRTGVSAEASDCGALVRGGDRESGEPVISLESQGGKKAAEASERETRISTGRAEKEENLRRPRRRSGEG